MNQVVLGPLPPSVSTVPVFPENGNPSIANPYAVPPGSVTFAMPARTAAERRRGDRNVANDARIETRDRATVGAANLAHDLRLIKRAAVDYRRRDVDHLQRSGLHRALPDSQEAGLARLHRHAEDSHLPSVGRPIPFVFSGKIDAGLRIQTKRKRILAQTRVTEPPREPKEIAVARCRQRRNESRVAEAARRNVARVIAAAIPSAGIVDNLIDSNDAFGERGGAGNHLEGRAGRRRRRDGAVEERLRRIG